MAAGLGALIATTGRARGRVLRDAVRDGHPVVEAIYKHGGKRYEDGGRDIVEEVKSAQNTTVKWIGENGTVNLTDQEVIDAMYFDWYYQMGAVVFTLAERYKNSGSGRTKFIDAISGKFEVLEDSAANEFHEAISSNGTASGGLQLPGIPALISTTPTSGTVGGIDRSDPAAAWSRNSSFDTSADWSDGAVDVTNVKAFLAKGLNSTSKNSKIQQQLGIMGEKHFEALTQATEAIQVLQNVNGKGETGFTKLYYRGIPFYLGNEINYSGASGLETDRTYLINAKRGGFNIVFHRQGEFKMLPSMNAQDGPSVSRLLFTMCATTIGGLAKTCWVGHDS